jgi:hypothetical protein
MLIVVVDCADAIERSRLSCIPGFGNVQPIS